MTSRRLIDYAVTNIAILATAIIADAMPHGLCRTIFLIGVMLAFGAWNYYDGMTRK